jgi:hypothetical protein
VPGYGIRDGMGGRYVWIGWIGWMDWWVMLWMDGVMDWID